MAAAASHRRFVRNLTSPVSPHGTPTHTHPQALLHPFPPHPHRPVSLGLRLITLRRSRRHVTGLQIIALLGLAGTLSIAAGAAGRAESGSPFRDDPRLRQPLTVRASRMPLSELLQRLGTALDVHLVTEGDDVADQKIDLFVKDLPAAETLTAVTDLLNSEGPKGYRWERAGAGPNYRYTLLRDLASRQWEAKQAAEAETRMVRLLRTRLGEISKDPFRPPPIPGPTDLPSMRPFVGTLSDAQIARLASERLLIFTRADCTARQKALLNEMVQQVVALETERRPESVPHAIGLYGPPDQNPSAYVRLDLLGDPPQQTLRMGIVASRLGGSTELGRIVDTQTLAGTAERRGGARPPAVPELRAADPESVFALPPRMAWLMGDVLADIAARAKVNLIADDYTQTWPNLARLRGAQPLSVWLAAIRDEYDFQAVREGAFLRLRNRHWCLDRGHETPVRLLSRWTRLLRGTPADRLQVAVEIAQATPFLANPTLGRDRLRRLTDSPEIGGLSPDLTLEMARVQTELLIYSLLPPAQRQEVTGAGLTLTWSAMSPTVRALFARRLRSWLEPGLSDELLHKSSLFLQFHDDTLRVRWQMPAPLERSDEVNLALRPGAEPPLLVGQPLPELMVTDVEGKLQRLRISGPRLLYVAPAWPRPAVIPSGDWADLRALERLSATEPATALSALVVGTEATAAELRDWWKERGLTSSPLALAPASAQQLGLQHLPLALVVDGNGRVTWAKEGYASGDEAEWWRQLEQARQ